MFKNLSLVAVLAMSLISSAVPAVAGSNHDHSASGVVGEAALQSGRDFVAGAKKVAEPFIVLGKTVVDGTTFVMLKGAQGVIYVAEEAVVGLKYLAKGAKFIIVKTAQGIRWVAVEALKAVEIVFDAVIDVAELVIDDVVYVLVKVEEGVVFVAKKALAAGKVIIKGVKYVAKETVEGIVWVSEQTWNAIKAGATFARDKVVATNIRTRLSSAMATGAVSENTIAYFSNMAANTSASESTRKLAAAALAACQAFNGVYNK